MTWASAARLLRCPARPRPAIHTRGWEDRCQGSSASGTARPPGNSGTAKCPRRSRACTPRGTRWRRSWQTKISLRESFDVVQHVAGEKRPPDEECQEPRQVSTRRRLLRCERGLPVEPVPRQEAESDRHEMFLDL